MKRLLLISTVLLAVFLAGCKTETKTKQAGFRFEEATIAQLTEGYTNGTFTISEVVDAYLKRIAEIDDAGPELNAVITVNPEAMAIAAQLDEEWKAGKIRGPMHGIPVLLKDNIDTKDKMPNTAGSTIMRESFPLQDSWVAAKLREAGAVIIGKTNLSEWANFHSSYSSSGWSGLGGQTKNPYDLTRNPCGSSSGSGAAVSANLAIIAIGTETDGSIVCPSNNNGIAGIKPTVGLISRSGIIPISFTQDTPGPMARTLADAVICLGALTGRDTTDAKTLDDGNRPIADYTQYLVTDGLKGKRLGLLTGPTKQNFRVEKVMREAVKYLESQGATIVEIDKLIDPQAGDWEFEVLLYEFKDGLNKYFASLGNNAPVKDLADLIAKTAKDTLETRWFDHRLLAQAQEKGPLTDNAYKKALDGMLRATRENGIDKVLKEHNLDAFIAPTGAPAWKTDPVNGDNFSVSSSAPPAMAGYPAVTVPMGAIDGLPVNITFFGTAWSEPELIKMAYSYEQGTKHRIVPRFLNGM